MTRNRESVLIAGDAVAGLFEDEGEALSQTLAEGTRLVTESPPAAAAAARYSHIPWPEMTVRLSELGFVIENAIRNGSDGAEVRLEARKTSVIVRRYRAGDEHAIRELFRRSFQQPLSSDAWRWRYCDNPLGTLRITVAVSAERGLIGHYGGYPMVFEHDSSEPFDPVQGKRDNVLLAHQNGDVMTDRSARRLGHGGASLVRRMAQHFWAAYGEGRVDFHYGFNTDTARELQRRVVPGVRVLEDVGSWVCEGRPAGFQVDVQAGTSLRVERVSRFDHEWNAFAQRVRGAYGTLTRRDATYLNWRYAERPASDEVLVVVRDGDRLVGGAVFRMTADETRWGDALFDPCHPAAPAAALDFLRSLGAPSRIRAWFSARPAWWVAILSDLGFQQERETHGLSFVYVPFTPAAERLVPRLYYSWGDSDLF